MSSEGLYGSSTATNLPRTFAAELIGTFFLVLIGAGTAVAAVLELPIAGTPAGSVGVALAFGLVLVALVCAAGNVSGCHLNPAVTVGLAVNGQFPWKYVIPYIVAQFSGALLASYFILAVYRDPGKTIASLGATQPRPELTSFGVGVVEFVATFFLVFVIAAVATDKRVPASVAGVAVGFALFAGIMFAGPNTGGGLNPARSLAPMIVSGKLEAWPIYLASQMLAGVLGVFVFGFLKGGVEPSEAEGN